MNNAIASVADDATVKIERYIGTSPNFGRDLHPPTAMVATGHIHSLRPSQQKPVSEISDEAPGCPPNLPAGQFWHTIEVGGNLHRLSVTGDQPTLQRDVLVALFF
jgi:hypothetical protein